MKPALLLLLAATLLLAGCLFESPLTEEHNVPVDPAVLGLWEPIPESGQPSDSDERMMILKYSDTEYLVHYPVGAEAMYFRCYPIKVEGVSCVQLQIIGTENGPPEADNKRRFHVASYQMKAGQMEIKLLNSQLISGDLKTTKELVDAFVKNKDSEKLFDDPETFRRVAQ